MIDLGTENIVPLRRFVEESNAIEGIFDTSGEEVNAHLRALSSPMSVDTLRDFVYDVAGANLRNRHGMDVRVGDWHPIAGGPEVESRLSDLLDIANTLTPFELYCRYETLHPFTDGNGRSGRLLWRHRQGRSYREVLQRGFLASFHYEALSAHDGRNSHD